MSRFRLIPAAVVIAALAGPASPAGATVAGNNGLIAYVRDVGRHAELFTANADGSGERQLTRLEGNAESPHWSPSGDRIVFSVQKTPRGCSLMVVNPDGSGLAALIEQQSGCVGSPSFTPDGQRIVFECYDDVQDVEGICSADASGGDRRPLVAPSRKGSETPIVSPDGSWVTFLRGPALFVAHADGSGMRRLTPDRWDVLDTYDWSPDAARIVFSTNHGLRPHVSANLLTIKPDGSDLQRLTHFKGGRWNAMAGSFSPDGRHIVFRLERGGKGGLATIDPDGRNLHRLTKRRASKPRYISWGPAGGAQ